MLQITYSFVFALHAIPHDNLPLKCNLEFFTKFSNIVQQQSSFLFFIFIHSKRKVMKVSLKEDALCPLPPPPIRPYLALFHRESAFLLNRDILLVSIVLVQMEAAYSHPQVVRLHPVARRTFMSCTSCF
jgi:hypothetical protein